MTVKVVDKTGWNYTIIDNGIVETESLDIYEKMLYISLKRFANIQTGEAFPGVKKISRMSGMSERKARSVISSLSDKKFIKVNHRLNQTSIYTLLPMPAQHTGHAPSAVGHAQGAVGVMHTMHEGGAHDADELKKHELKKYELKKDNDIVDKSPIQKLYDHYISKKVINHNSMTGPMKTAANARLKDYSYEQLVQAIDNYSIIYHGNEYWFNTKYGFADLMRDKDIRKFIDDADPLNNFANNDIRKRGVSNANNRPGATRNDAVKSKIETAHERRKRIAGIQSN